MEHNSQKGKQLGRVVITGVAGFLGSHLADKFLAEGWEVVGVDNFIGGYEDNIPKGVEFYERDLTELDLEEEFWKSDLLIHAAALAYEGLSVFSPALISKNIIQSSVNLATIAVKHNIPRFVYLSSMARYGDHDGEMFFEDFTLKPQDPYGIAKASSEQLIRNILDTHGVAWTIIVPHNIIGSRQKYDDPYRNVASIFVNRMLSGKQPIIYGDGSQQRCFSFVGDVVEPLYKATQIQESVSEVINVGPDRGTVTIAQLAEAIAEKLEFDLDPIYMTGRPQEVPIATCSAQKARELLGYEAKTTLNAGLDELISYIKNRGAKSFEYHLPLEIINERTPATWNNKLM